MQFLSFPPYSKRAVPQPEDGQLPKWAKALAAWLTIEGGNIQRGTARATSRSVTAATTALQSDGLLLCNGTFTVTLPAPNLVPDMIVTIKNIGAGTITVGGTVDGSLNPTLATGNHAMTIWAETSVSDAGAWRKVASV